MLQPFRHVGGVPVVPVEADAPVRFVGSRRCLEQESGDMTADRHFPRHIMLVGFELTLGPVDQRDDLLRASVEQHAILRQCDASASAFEQLLAQLVFELRNLLGQRRLRHHQRLGGAGETLLPGDGKEISQYANIHHQLLPTRHICRTPSAYYSHQL